MMTKQWRHAALMMLGWVVVIGGAVTWMSGCGKLLALNDPCATADDCPAPWVCCNELRLPNGDPVPQCEERTQCVSWMPLLVEGNPCGRTQSGSVDEQCRADLECCATTLTCAQPGQCPEAPTPPAEGGSGAQCGADLDCGEGEICCSIDYVDRDGVCSTVAECASGDLPTPPLECEDGSGSVCGDVCVDLQSDDTNCGTCGVRCPLSQACVEGVCVSRQQTCTAPFVDCNGDPSDACETNTDTNFLNCGGCNNVCPTSYPGGSDLGCRDGACDYLCNGGFHDCNGDPADGCESTTRCR